eukprot:11695978-Ditylum_brightwellii.AAC.1
MTKGDGAGLNGTGRDNFICGNAKRCGKMKTEHQNWVSHVNYFVTGYIFHNRKGINLCTMGMAIFDNKEN